VITEVFP